MIGHPPVSTVPNPTLAQRPPDKLTYEERRRVSRAVHEARRRYPGVAGQVLANEIDFYLVSGFRTDQRSLIPRLIAELTDGITI